jgi:8-oxo-dGTP diphosphatase
VKVGVTVLITWKNKLLLARRKGSHGPGTWDSPGGHLDPGEKVLDCAIRETLEETNLQLDSRSISEIGFTEDFFKEENKHYISCVVRCEIDGKTMLPSQNEPDKFDTPWTWFEIDNLPDPLFIPISNTLIKYKIIE